MRKTKNKGINENSLNIINFNNRNIINNAVQNADIDWFFVAKDPVESKYFFLIKISIYFSVLSIIFLNLINKFV